ncbi:hypothetical protein K438DRAFT_2113779 [Mycena galopus ATCC 62051]|nr:hypothetical protein K438DRAFT_2113779 [Mycena galopus ATCC 62051]
MYLGCLSPREVAGTKTLDTEALFGLTNHSRNSEVSVARCRCISTDVSKPVCACRPSRPLRSKHGNLAAWWSARLNYVRVKFASRGRCRGTRWAGHARGVHQGNIGDGERPPVVVPRSSPGARFERSGEIRKWRGVDQRGAGDGEWLRVSMVREEFCFLQTSSMREGMKEALAMRNDQSVRCRRWCCGVWQVYASSCEGGIPLKRVAVCEGMEEAWTTRNGSVSCCACCGWMAYSDIVQVDAAEERRRRVRDSGTRMIVESSHRCKEKETRIAYLLCERGPRFAHKPTTPWIRNAQVYSRDSVVEDTIKKRMGYKDRPEYQGTYDARDVPSQRGWAIRVHAVRGESASMQRKYGANTQKP